MQAIMLILIQVIEDAMGFYDSFLQSFYRDVQFIKSYAGSEILDHLWRSKVGASHNRNGAKIRDRASHANDREMTMPEPGMGFQDIARDLCEHIHATLTIAGKQRQARDGENAAHVFTKLGKSVKGLTNDMERAPFRAKDTKNLMTELEMLLTFLSANGAGRSNQREMAGDQNLRMEQHYDEQEGPTDCEGEQGELLGDFDQTYLPTNRRHIEEY